MSSGQSCQIPVDLELSVSAVANQLKGSNLRPFVKLVHDFNCQVISPAPQLSFLKQSFAVRVDQAGLKLKATIHSQLPRFGDYSLVFWPQLLSFALLGLGQMSKPHLAQMLHAQLYLSLPKILKQCEE